MPAPTPKPRRERRIRHHQVPPPTKPVSMDLDGWFYVVTDDELIDTEI